MDKEKQKSNWLVKYILCYDDGKIYHVLAYIYTTTNIRKYLYDKYHLLTHKAVVISRPATDEDRLDLNCTFIGRDYSKPKIVNSPKQEDYAVPSIIRAKRNDRLYYLI